MNKDNFNIEQRLKELKESYDTIKLSDQFVASGWFKLEEKMEVQQSKYGTNIFFFPKKLIFAFSVALLIFGGLFYIVSISVSGNLLYPAKRFSEDVIVRTVKDHQIKVDHRALEIIQLAKEGKDPNELKKTVIEYQHAVSEERQDLEQSGKNTEEFKEKLQTQEQQFRQSLEQAAVLRTSLSQAIMVAHEGEQDTTNPSTNDDGNNQTNVSTPPAEASPSAQKTN